MDGFDVKVNRKILFMKTVIRKFSGNAFISFEGRLSRVDLTSIRGSSVSETTLLKRCTIQPLKDFVIVPIEADTQESIISMLRHIGIRTRVDHLQIEKEGRLVFISNDGFEFLWISEDIGEAVLAELQRTGVIKNYRKKR